MRRVLSLWCSLFLLSAAFAEPSAPPISQVFAFLCNQGYTACPDGFDPELGPIQLSNGALYGTTFWGGQGSSSYGGTVWKVTTTGKSSVLHTFASSSNGSFPDGENPAIGFVEGKDGSFYGVTEQGGTNNAGVFYKVTPTGKFQVLYNFCSLSGCPDEASRIVLANDGNFYGAIYETVFRITPQGAWSLVYTLNPTTDGTASGNLIQASDGNFYGTGTIGDDLGMVFKVTPEGQYSIFYQFTQLGAGVTSNLIQASNGNFYGGSNSSIFQLTPSGEYTTTANLTQAEGPTPTFLMQASDGNLWGLAVTGGTGPNRPGTLFAFTTTGTLVTTEEFNCAKGCSPLGMTEGSDGNFYGIAVSDGSGPGHPMGTIFKVDAAISAAKH